MNCPPQQHKKVWKTRFQRPVKQKTLSTRWFKRCLHECKYRSLLVTHRKGACTVLQNKPLDSKPHDVPKMVEAV